MIIVSDENELSIDLSAASPPQSKKGKKRKGKDGNKEKKTKKKSSGKLIEKIAHAEIRLCEDASDDEVCMFV